jgi:uncharacterized protein with ParB-like and HNH nuclease domain
MPSNGTPDPTDQGIAALLERAKEALSQVTKYEERFKPLARDDPDTFIKVARVAEELRRIQAESKVRDLVTKTFVFSFAALVFIVLGAICAAPLLGLEEKRIGYLFDAVNAFSTFLALILGYYFGSNAGPKQ